MPAVSKKQQRFFGYLLSNPEERKKKGISKKAAKDFAQDVKEVAPPGWGHTKAEKEKTKPWKPKSKIGGTAAAFKRALDDGRFKGLPGDKTKKEKTASMFKLMWSMKKKGDKPHYKPGTDKKYKKYQEEEKQITPMQDNNLFGNAYAGSKLPKKKKKIKESLSVKDAKKLDKASALSQSDDPKDQDRARVRQTEVDYKDLMQQRKKGKVGVGKSMRLEGSFQDYMAQAQAARDRLKKKQSDRKTKDAAYVDRVTKGVKFYDKKGSGRIVKGKKVYD